MGQLEHNTFKALKKAEAKYKRWGGKEEIEKLFKAKDDYQEAKNTEKRCKEIRERYGW